MSRDYEKETAGLREAVELMIQKNHEGTLHEAYCNADHSGLVGGDGCSCKLGRIIRGLRTRVLELEGRLKAIERVV